MRIALALSAICVVAFGCGRSAAPVAPVATAKAAAIPTTTNSLKLEIRPASYVEAPSPAVTNTFTKQIVWEFKFAEFREQDIGRVGLKEMFDGRGEKNDLVRKEVERSPMVRIARGNTNVNLTLRSGGYAGFISATESSNLIKHLETLEAVDVLTPAKAITAADRSAMIQVANVTPVVVPGMGTNSGAILTTNLDTGITVNLRAFELSGDGLGIEVSGRIQEFSGYSGDGKIGGAPNFDVTALGSRVKMGRDEVLLLGSAMRMRVTKWKEKVQYLGDVPVLGRFFTKSGSDTNFYRVVMIARPTVK